MLRGHDAFWFVDPAAPAASRTIVRSMATVLVGSGAGSPWSDNPSTMTLDHAGRG